MFELTKVTPTSSGPTVSISSSSVSNGGTTTASVHTFNFVTSESTTDFDGSDVTVTGGIVGTMTGSGTNYSISFTVFGVGTKTIEVQAGAFTNSSGTINQASATYSFLKT